MTEDYGVTAHHLRHLAGDASIEWVTGPIRASVLRDAADTIWELRDDLQRANDAVRDAEHDESRAWDRVRKDEAESAKLRDALKSLMMGTNAELCVDRDESNCKECSMHHGKDGCTVVDAMELLGIDMYGEPLEVKETYGPVDDLMAENAKLRELVRDMWPHVRHRSRMCADCELPCDKSNECLLYEPMRDRMRELGIEVDG
jgi:hypothetical protein